MNHKELSLIYHFTSLLCAPVVSSHSEVAGLAAFSELTELTVFIARAKDNYSKEHSVKQLAVTLVICIVTAYVLANIYS